MVGQVGVEPTTPEGNGFTVHRVCRFATDPYKAFRVPDPSAASLSIFKLLP